jgi:hypothetical protein
MQMRFFSFTNNTKGSRAAIRSGFIVIYIDTDKARKTMGSTDSPKNATTRTKPGNKTTKKRRRHEDDDQSVNPSRKQLNDKTTTE